MHIRKTLVACAAALIAGLGITAAVTMPAHAVPSGSDYTGPVYSFASGQCLDVANAFGTGTSGLKLQTYSCGAIRFEDQVFHYNHTLSELLYVAANGSQECVVPSMSTPYDVLQLGTCAGSPAVTMDLQTGFVQFDFATTPATVMDVKGKGGTNATPVGVFGSNSGANQDFHIIQNPGSPAS